MCHCSKLRFVNLISIKAYYYYYRTLSTQYCIVCAYLILLRRCNDLLVKNLRCSPFTRSSLVWSPYIGCSTAVAYGMNFDLIPWTALDNISSLHYSVSAALAWNLALYSLTAQYTSSNEEQRMKRRYFCLRPAAQGIYFLKFRHGFPKWKPRNPSFISNQLIVTDGQHDTYTANVAYRSWARQKVAQVLCCACLLSRC